MNMWVSKDLFRQGSRLDRGPAGGRHQGLSLLEQCLGSWGQSIEGVGQGATNSQRPTR